MNLRTQDQTESAVKGAKASRAGVNHLNVRSLATLGGPVRLRPSART